MKTNFVVFQAYGLEDILNEALVAIASIYKVTNVENRPQIVVFTDSESYLSSFLPAEIKYIDTPKFKWEEWKGSACFVHRAKIEMLRNFCEDHIGNVLYCDTDTYFLSNPSSLFYQISEGNVLMHLDEGMLKDSENLVFRKVGKFLANYQYKGHFISTQTHMWNAGVLGFKTANKEMLDEVLELSDDLYSAYPKHVMEQFAFSICFGKKTRLACDETIFHYWDFKEYRNLLRDFFATNRNFPFENWTEKVEEYSPVVMYKLRLKYLAKPYLWRKILRIFGVDEYLPRISK